MTVTFTGFKKTATTKYDDMVVVVDIVKLPPPLNRGLLDFYGLDSPIIAEIGRASCRERV